MSAYAPPIENVPMFNADNFSQSVISQLTSAEADKRYLQYPIAQGTETLKDITVNGFANFNGSASFSTPPSCASNTFTATNLITQGGLLPLTNNWTGINTFDQHLPTSVLQPTNTTELTNKSYVDSKLSSSSLLSSNNTWQGSNSFSGSIPTTTKSNTSTNTTELATVGFVNSVTSNYLLNTSALSFLTKNVADTLYASQSYITNALYTQSQSIANNYLTPSKANASYLSINDAISSYVTWNNAYLSFALKPQIPIRTVLTCGMSGIYQPPIGSLYLEVQMIGGGCLYLLPKSLNGQDSTFTDNKGLNLVSAKGTYYDVPNLLTRSIGGDINYMGQGIFTGLANGMGGNFPKALAGYGNADCLVKTIYPVLPQYSYYVGRGGDSPYNDGLIIVIAHFQ
jgi:hypothetical protein